MITNLQHEQFVKQVLAFSEDTVTEKKQEYNIFQQHYFSSVSHKNLSEIGPDKAAFIVRKQWQLAQKRKSKETLLQIYSPSLQQDGYESEFTHINIITIDKPFLIDSVSLALNHLGYTLENVFHPIFNVKRKNTALQSISIDVERQSTNNESFMHFIINKVIDQDEEKRIAKTLLSVLKDVEHSVNDWPKNREALTNEIQKIDDNKVLPGKIKNKAAAYLKWLADDNFIVLGSAVFDGEKQGKKIRFTINDGTRLGLLKSQDAKLCDFNFTEKQHNSVTEIEDILVVSKSSLRSTVHRTVYCDTISIKRFDKKCNAIGELRFWGLYTSSAYRENPKNIPIVQDKIDYAFKLSKLSSNNHQGKALMHTLVTYPRDELMSISSKDLAKFSLDIAELKQHQHASVYIRPDYYNRYISCLVYIPRDSYDYAMRESIASVFMQECDVDHYEYLMKITDESLVRLEMLAMLNEANADKLNLDIISYKIQLAAKTWNDHLQTTLVSQAGVVKGNLLFNRYKNALPLAYKNSYDDDIAYEDIQVIESMSTAQKFDLCVSKSESKQEFNVRLYSQNEFIAPSDTMPIFNNMSVRVLFEEPYKVAFLDEASKEKVVYIHDYRLEYKDGYDQETIESNFKQAFSDVWHQKVENDGLNKLTMAASLTSREVVAFRVIAKYLLQACLPFSQQYIEQTLIENKEITHKLLELFATRFNPGLHTKQKANGTKKKIQKLEKNITEALEHVVSLDQDRILRNILSVINAVVRTNFYQVDDGGQEKPYVSIKLDTSKVLELPDPRPMFEIFVYSPKTEGVHLRGGKVARGGLRWSDRREDFRTEVLGLMKAQMVKNSVIVPVGSKGGFVMKQAPVEGGREALMAEVVNCYKTFINALLDVTDNVVNNKVVPPKNVVRHDENDTYLVVAADKGTATFSDIANEISVSRNFWLGDAFASGGSIGYDHKKMGITAKGAWESVKLNFRDLGKNIQKQDFTVVGIGDMAGDVFGNGMLLSKHIQLVAAFNHMHIFIDPNPDAATSFKERKRLFNLPRSSWTDYKSELISKGGGVYSRSDKVIKLSQAARKALGIEEEKLSPDALINKILKAPVDLLWNGGIGTYIKASHEQHTDAGDKANDGLRVNGDELRCLCVGEGGNLGVTQQGRIQYALNGGRIDTDFIHNAGGVDCSDHEVNIKILLYKLLESGELTEAKRVKLLESMTDDVSEVVLLSNYWQGQAITQVEHNAINTIDEHALYINHLEKIGRLDRALEGLPDNDVIHQRKLEGKSLVRPEIAVLVSYAKMTAYDTLLDSGLWKDKYYANELTRYFPVALVNRFNKAVHQHPLRKEILSTFIVNRMINRMGPTFAFKLNQEIGASISDVARAYTIAWESFDLRHLWQSISALDNKVDGALQTSMMLNACKLIERSSRWLIQHRRKRLGICETINDYSHGAEALSKLLPVIYEKSQDDSVQSQMAGLQQAKVPDDVIAKIVAMDDYYCTFDIVEVANKYKVDLNKVAKMYFHVYSAMDVKLLRDKINAVNVDNHWQERNRSALIDDLYTAQRVICEKVIVVNKSNKKSPTVAKQFAHWLSLNNDTVEPYQQCLAEFKMADNLDMAMLSVAVRLLAQTTG